MSTKKIFMVLSLLVTFTFTLSTVSAMETIKHKFVATDESGGQLLYVDETNPANDWTVPLPGNRDIQLSKEGTILVTVPDGYREYALKDGELIKEVRAGNGVRSLVRMDNGHTILASQTEVIELDKNDKQVKDYGIKIGGSIRLLRLSKSGNFLYTSSGTAVKEVKPNAETVRELEVTGFDRQTKKPYSVEELDNGQFMISTGYGGSLLLVDKDWKLVKSFGGKGKIDGILAYYFSDSQRLSNGNFVVANWTGHSRKDSEKGPQLIEFDKDGKVVWTWHDPKRAGTLHGIEIIEEKKNSIPKVLIIGDSISLGYTPPVVKMLKGEAVVKHSNGGRGVGANAGATDRGIEYLDKYLGDEKWDVIHFNWGLWDICYRHPDAKTYGNRDKVNGTISIPIDQYEKNLEELVVRLKKTGAKLIWASTTKVPEGEAGRIVGDEVKYNQAAAKIMKKHGVVIDDLYALTSSFDSSMFVSAGDVHYKPAGYARLAEQAAAAIRDALASDGDLKHHFANPPLKYAPRPLWFWNDTEVTEQGIVEQMQMSRDKCGYGGFGILPFGMNFKPKYLTEDYFKIYGAALKKARELGMTMCIYDEYGYPSGSAGAIHGDGIGRFANKYPEHTIKRLDKREQDIIGPAEYSAEIPGDGRLMSIVAMEMQTKKRIDLTGLVKDGKITWAVGQGNWKIMIFICVKDGDPNVDYLDPEGVAHFVEMTHQQYYDRFKEYFGNTIDGTFNDEPTMYRAKGRMWTGGFNEKFKAKYGFDPAPYYPALWYDIGDETQAARNYLFGFRSELYATGFPKVIQDWCDKHAIAATGHQDQEEVVNPVSVSGDLMLCFKHQDIPGVDKIGGNRPAERFYKVISSVAYNWDKALVMSETYGAMGDISWETMYHVAMEQYTKGINQLIPHAVWYDPAGRIYKPELSWRHPKYADGLPQYNKYMSRLNLMLQNHGRHVADIAVLYPIATLQAGHHLDGKLGHYKGGVTIPEADYVEIGELLATEVGRDYTFIHPQVLDEKCTIEGTSLKLENPVNYEEYKVMIMPAHKTISWPNLKKIKAFYDAGGKVIATGTLPSKSAEFGHDKDVAAAVMQMFPNPGKPIVNEKGGKAVFLQKPTANTMRQILDSMLDVYDVEFETGKELRYIHKVKDGKDIYFFANLSEKPVKTFAKLRGDVTPESWDPHTGEIATPEYSYEKSKSTGTTKVKIELPPMKSLFIISEK